jgi:hypothetical protein
VTVGLHLDPWWDEPYYKAAKGSFSSKGAFILRKLAQHDAVKLNTVMTDLYRDEEKDPQDITKFEWQTILAFMGASDEEIKDVQMRMGRPWR